MKIITVGLPHKYVEELRAFKVVVDCAEEEDFDPMDWLGEGLYDAMLINLDEGFGTMICRGLRREGINTPVLAIATYDANSFMSWSEMRASFLDNGGDDILQIPFNPTELLASMRSTIRRINGSSISILTFSDDENIIKMDQVTYEVYVNDIPVLLTGKEREMLQMLMSKQGHTITKEQFLNYMYDGRDEPELKIIDVFICKLRKKLSIATGGKNYIETVWGKGYVLRKNSAPYVPETGESPSALAS